MDDRHLNVCTAVTVGVGALTLLFFLFKWPTRRAPAPSRRNILAPCMSIIEIRQLQLRLDVRAETSLFAARPLLLWAFQSSQWQLQAVVRPRPSLLRVSAAQSHAFGSHFGSKQRQSLITCSRLCLTLAVRLMCFQSACAVTHPLRQAACILSRRHKLPVLRLGGVAAVGAGFVRVIGSEGAGNGQFNSPYGGVAFDGEGNLVVCDGNNHRIQVFRYSDGAHLRSIGSQGAGNGQFDRPWSIAFDGAGHIIVSENRNHRVQVLRYSDGAHVRTIGRGGSGGKGGSGNGQFDHPSGIAVDGEGNIAVFDDNNGRVQVHRLSDGAYLRTIGSQGRGDGQFGDYTFNIGSSGSTSWYSKRQFRAGPCGIAFDSDGNLVVADCLNHRVQVLSYRGGKHLRTIGSQGAGAGQFEYPMGVAFDAAGHIVVVDQRNHRVQVLRYSDGAHVRTIGRGGSGIRRVAGVRGVSTGSSCAWGGSGNGQFNFPCGGIAIDSDGRIVVADTHNHRLQVLE